MQGSVRDRRKRISWGIRAIERLPKPELLLWRCHSGDENQANSQKLLQKCVFAFFNVGLPCTLYFVLWLSINKKKLKKKNYRNG